MGQWNAPSRILTPPDYFLDAARGKVAGLEIIKKFGYSDSIGTVFKPVAYSDTYPMPTAAVALEIISDNAADNAAGIGAREVTIIGLAADWTEQIVTVVPTGLTAAAITGTWLRVYRAFVSSSGTYGTETAGSHQGNLTIRVASAGATYAEIDATDYPRGQTQIACYSVPTGKCAYIGNIVATVDATKALDLIGFHRPNADDVSAPYAGAVRLFMDSHGLDSVALNAHSPYGPFDGPCDIGFMAKVVSGTHSAGVSFEIYLDG
jgi:hypothetical protein